MKMCQVLEPPLNCCNVSIVLQSIHAGLLLPLESNISFLFTLCHVGQVFTIVEVGG
jgi:hypothetical protein